MSTTWKKVLRLSCYLFKLLSVHVMACRDDMGVSESRVPHYYLHKSVRGRGHKTATYGINVLEMALKMSTFIALRRQFRFAKRGLVFTDVLHTLRFIYLCV